MTLSGKSSILALLLRLINPLSSGPPDGVDPKPSAVLIDELPLVNIDRTTLRERIISASQDSVLLPDGTSYRTNLDPWAAASEAECADALQDLGLATAVDAKG